MNHSMNDAIIKAAKIVYDNEKFSIYELANKLEKAAEYYPQDNTVVGMRQIFVKKASTASDPFISRRELKDLYNKLYTQNNKFGLLFKEELGLVDPPAPKKAAEQKDLIQEAQQKMINPVLVHQLEGLFDKSKAGTLSPQILTQAEENTRIELKSQGLAANKIKATAGKEDIIICQASFDTPRGTVQVYLPVEISCEKVLFPSCFLNGQGFTSLNAQSLQNYIISKAGTNTWIDSKVLVTKLASILRPVESDELDSLIINYAAGKGTPAYCDNGIVGQALEVEIPESAASLNVAIPSEIKTAAEHWSKVSGQAEFVHGKTAVELGRKMIKQALSQFGYKNAQLGVVDFSDKQINFAVSLDGQKSLRIPVGITKGQIQSPAYVLASTEIFEFSPNGISEALSQASLNTTDAAKISPSYELKASDLIDRIKIAMEQNQYDQAEDALLVLQERHSPELYQLGFAMYQAGLKGELNKTAETNASCNFQIKNGSSQHVLCGHTMLPLHKVYQDQFGNCHKLYRKGMQDVHDGANFMASKIILT